MRLSLVIANTFPLEDITTSLASSCIFLSIVIISSNNLSFFILILPISIMSYPSITPNDSNILAIFRSSLLLF